MTDSGIPLHLRLSRRLAPVNRRVLFIADDRIENLVLSKFLTTCDQT